MTNKSSVFTYVLIVVTSALLCIGSVWFVTNKEVQKNVDITRTATNGFVSTEYYVQLSMKNATLAVNYYLNATKGLNYTPDYRNPDELKPLSKELGVDSISIYDSNGYIKYNISGNLLKDKNWKQSRNIFVCPDRAEMKKEGFSYRGYPLRCGLRSTFVYSDFAGQSWFKSRNEFIGVGIRPYTLADLVSGVLANNYNVKKIIVSSPSGAVLMDAYEHGTSSPDADRRQIDIVVEDYSETPITRSTITELTISLPFGGLKDNCSTTIDSKGDKSGTANSAGQYFYVMNVTFDRTSLNVQICGIVLIYLVLTALACLYVKTKYELISTTHEKAEKILHLCNTRLGDVRRYVTKITRDNMRTRNMKLELDSKAFEELEELFREIDEK